MSSDRAGLIETCHARALELLRANATPAGILACARTERALGRHYVSVFGRDAAICALGMVASGEADLIASAQQSLVTLAHHQAPNGQIPKYVKPELNEADFWYAGCIDATLWWLIALRFFDRHVPQAVLGQRLALQVRRALNWLSCQEHQGFFLLQQNEASDWADIMPRSGFVLYSNVLWYWVKRLYDLPALAQTRYYFNYLFFPFGRERADHRRARLLAHYVRNRIRRRDTYLSFVNFSFWGEEVDVFGNILTLLAGLPRDSRTSTEILQALRRLGVSHPYPVRVVGVPLERGSPLWRSYMQRHQQNLPYQYHNGGIWPFVGGFWVMLLARLGRRAEAWEALGSLAAVNRINDWEFNEWFHGISGEPMGMPGQSWNATMFVLAYHTLRHGLDPGL